MSFLKKNFFILLLTIFFIYELLAIKYNFFSLSLVLLSSMTFINNSANSDFKNFDNIIKDIVYNNPFVNSEILNYIEDFEVVGITDVVSFSNDFFYVISVKNISKFDVVVNEKNFLGIVDQVSDNLSRVRYIKSKYFEIPSKAIISNKIIVLGIIKNLSFLFFYPIEYQGKLDGALVYTTGYFHIPNGIPIGYINNDNEVILYKDIIQTDKVIVLRKKR
jgi:hypothetical protein